MSNLIKKTILSTALVGLFTLPVQADVIDTVEKSFNVDSNSTFTLSNINGAVGIASWQEDSIKIVATIEADNQDDRDRITVKMQQSGQRVSVSTHYEKNSDNRNSHSGEVSYKVLLPENTNLSDIELVNGSLTIEGVKGEVEAELVNGSITAKGLAKNSEISSVNGSIKAYYQEFDKSFNDIDIETVNGSIKLFLPSDINAQLDLETMHGSIKTDFGLVAKKTGFVGRSLRGDIGSGEAKINLESVNGSIKVLKN